MAFRHQVFTNIILSPGIAMTLLISKVLSSTGDLGGRSHDHGMRSCENKLRTHNHCKITHSRLGLGLVIISPLTEHAHWP